MTTHELKTWPAYFIAVCIGEKTFEVRKNDRKFTVDDILHLREWCPDLREYTGRDTRRRVSYVLPGGRFGIEAGYVVMGLEQVDEQEAVSRPAH